MRLLVNVVRLSLVLVLTILTYLYLSSPNAVVVGKDRDIEGLANQARGYLQGDRFWEDQLEQAKGRLKLLQSGPNSIVVEQRIFESELDKIEYIDKRRKDAWRGWKELTQPEVEKLQETIKALETATH